MKKFKKTIHTDVRLPSGECAISKVNITNIVGDKEVVVFSPHLDDAVLSMGSFISHLLKNKNKVTVISVFTKTAKLDSPSIKVILDRASFTDAELYFKNRKLEDAVALSTLGKEVNVRYLDLVDAAWRSRDGKPLYPSTQITEVNILDADQNATIQTKIRNLHISTDNVVVFAPLARGRHVDHTLTRNAVMSVFSDAIFYEDFPYSATYEDEGQFIKDNDLVDLSWDGDYEIKKTAILKYSTQMVTLFLAGPMILPYEKYYANHIMISTHV